MTNTSSTVCVYINQEASAAFNPNWLSKMEDFPSFCAVTYTAKVSQKWCKIDMLSLHTANRKYHIAYRFLSFPFTLNDLEGHLPVARLLKCNSINICATFRTVSTDTTRRAVPWRQLSYLS